MSHRSGDRVSVTVVTPEPPHKSARFTGVGIIADGGWYVMPEERDLPSAYHRALQAGVGIVVPVRDYEGHLVISRGLPTDHSPLLSEMLADRPVWPGPAPMLAIRTCSEGLATLLHKAVGQIDDLVPCAFGMSIPDMAAYLDGTIPIFARQSEHEPIPSFYEMAEGVWLESFERDWYDERLVLQHLRAGKLVTIVSPDIHGRSNESIWALLKKLQDDLGELSSRLQVCTQSPQDARSYFSN